NSTIQQVDDNLRLVRGLQLSLSNRRSLPHPIRTSLTSLVQHNTVSVLPTALVTLEVGVRRYDIRIATSLATAYGLTVTRVGAEGFGG
ncbi:hypothetical protein ACLKA7_000083, partial [Drosophila subpalustris]